MKPLAPYALLCSACGGVMYWSTRPIERGEVVRASDLIATDGSKPVDGVYAHCGTCDAEGEGVYPTECVPSAALNLERLQRTEAV